MSRENDQTLQQALKELNRAWTQLARLEKRVTELEGIVRSLEARMKSADTPSVTRTESYHHDIDTDQLKMESED